MAQRVPDDLFRKRPPGPKEQARPQRRARRVPIEVPRPLKELDGVSVRSTALLAVVVLLTAFLLGRFVFFAPSSPELPTTEEPAPEVPAQTAAAVYTAATSPVIIHEAHSDCGEGEGSAHHLIDDLDDTIWRCPGDGVAKTIQFSFGGREEVVGLRVSNGNPDDDRYHLERRITSIRWEFCDGYFFEQGLLTSGPAEQEVRIPPITCGQAKMTVQGSTLPGDAEASSDTVTIATVKFLTAQR